MAFVVGVGKRFEHLDVAVREAGGGLLARSTPSIAVTQSLRCMIKGEADVLMLVERGKNSLVVS
jgi:hypothetical protein